MPLGSELKHYLFSLRKKRRKQQLDDILLAIIFNKNKDEDIVEAIEKSNINCKTKEELIDWINCGELKSEMKK